MTGGRLGGDDNNWIDNVDFAHFFARSTSAANVFSGFFGSQQDSCTWTSD